jgi:hypothetical protein
MLVWTSQASPPSMPSMIMTMKHSPMLPTSTRRDIKAFFCSTNGPKFRLVIIVDRKGTSDHAAKSILLQKQMVLFPLHMRNGPICQYLPIPRIAAISFKRIQNSRHFCLLFSAFTTKYLAESPTDENEDAANDNNADNVSDVHDDDDDINAFLGMVGALKE